MLYSVFLNFVVFLSPYLGFGPNNFFLENIVLAERAMCLYLCLSSTVSEGRKKLKHFKKRLKHGIVFIDFKYCNISPHP